MNRSIRMGLIAISVSLVASLAIIGWRAKVTSITDIVDQRQLPAAQGDKAVEYLKQEGLYASLREAMRETRYGVKWTERSSLPDERSAYGASNPAQQFYSRFTPDALHLADSSQPDKAWRMELRLRSVGYGARQREVSAGQLTATGTRIEYRREAGGPQKAVGSQDQSSILDPPPSITEWYVNRTDGLEQGFTLAAAPGERRAGERLRVEMALEGDVRAKTIGAGQAIELMRASGERVLRYDHLVVKDARGRKLQAAMGAERGQVWLEVDDAEAVYPVTIDPTITQQAYLKASNTDVGDNFGNSVAISGDTVVVGAPFEDSNATGVNGDQNDNSVSSSGAAYVFVRGGTGWIQQAYLKASNTDPFDDFGYSVAISGETVVVSAPFENSNATGVNGDQSNNSASDSGAAYVFVRSGAMWSQQAYLKASNTDRNDHFSFSVAISGDTVVVGAEGEASNATGVSGNQSDNSAPFSGAAYVFVRSGTTWSQQAYLKASNTDMDDHFGSSVAISGDTVVVGAAGEDSNATGVNGNQSDNSALGAGAGYVFVRSGATWSQQAYLKASNTDAFDVFGRPVAISGDTVVIGAIGESSNATGLNGNQNDNSALGAGAAYVFVRSATTWSQQSYLKASNTDAFDQFGLSVAISGDTVVVGASLEDSNATGINGNQSDNSGDDSGAAYVFVRSGTTWSQQAYLKASNTDDFDRFGWSVAISGDAVVVGAPLEDSNAAGVNGDQSDNSAIFSGAAYVFAPPCTITCPPNQFASTGPGATQCCAVVNFSPTADAGCGTVTCSPASGSCFPVGTTTVTCNTTAGPSCSFTVTVTDNTPPTITCPPSANAVGAASCPIATSAPVNFTVTASDNCPGVTVVCKNQNNQVVTSGQPFPVGTTTVTCTATDAAGNTATCSFSVNTFSFCLQDETNAGNVVLVNAQTGDYSFCCGGVPIANGRGTPTTRGCIGSIDHVKGDRRVHILWDTAANGGTGAGTAIVQVGPNKTVCQITDKKMSNNTCACSSPPSSGSPKSPPAARVF